MPLSPRDRFGARSAHAMTNSIALPDVFEFRALMGATVRVRTAADLPVAVYGSRAK